MKAIWHAVVFIFKAVGWLILLILFLLAFPVRLDLLLQRGSSHVRLEYLFLKFDLYPGKKKGDGEELTEGDATEDADDGSEGVDVPQDEASAEDAKEAVSDEKLPSQQNGGRGLKKIMSLMRRIMKPAFWFVRMLLKAVHVDDVTVAVNVTGEDPASVGFRSGIQWGLIGSFMKDLNLIFGKNVTYGEVTVYPCFGDAQGTQERLGARISASPLLILMITIGFLFGFLIETIKDYFSRRRNKDVN